MKILTKYFKIDSKILPKNRVFLKEGNGDWHRFRNPFLLQNVSGIGGIEFRIHFQKLHFIFLHHRIVAHRSIGVAGINRVENLHSRAFFPERRETCYPVVSN